MIDVIASLIAHCKADSTLTALVPAAQIATEMDVTTTSLPQLDISEVNRTRDEGSIAALVRFGIRTAPPERSKAISIRDRLAGLFASKYSYIISSGANALLVVSSQYRANEGVNKETADGANELHEDYEFYFPPEA